MPNNKYDIYDRIFKFIVSVIKFIRLLPKTEENLVIIRQILRSVTSVGANSQEGDGVSTKKGLFTLLYNCQKRDKRNFVLVEINN